MKTSLMMRTLIIMLALEWELCSQDPFVFCYRMECEPARAFLGRLGQRRRKSFRWGLYLFTLSF